MLTLPEDPRRVYRGAHGAWFTTFPARVWEKSEAGWHSRSVTYADIKRRDIVAEALKPKGD